MRRAPGTLLVSLLLVGACAGGGAGSVAVDPELRAAIERARLARQATRTPSLAASEPTSAAELLLEGDLLRDSGDPAGAMWSYLQAHRLERDAVEPLARMASLHLAAEPQRAVELFARLAEVRPEDAAAHTGLGLARIAEGSFEAAHASLARALELAPDLVAARSAVGVVLDQLERPAEARVEYLRALALQPRCYEAQNNLGVSYLATGEWTAAATAFQRAAALETRDPAVFNNLGVALARDGRYGDALTAFRHAGSEQQARNNLGYLRFLNGDVEGAIAEYERALLAQGDDRLHVLRNLQAARGATATP